jgi:tetratricopeptide (TPR) repeat protein
MELKHSDAKKITNIFDEIHSHLRKREYEFALTLLLKSNSTRLRLSFMPFANHGWYLVGNIHFQTQKYDKATKAFANSLRHDPDDSMAILALAYCYSELKQFRRAKNLLLKGRLAAPRDNKIKYNLANAYFDLGKFDSALELYRSLFRCSDPEIANFSRKNAKIARNKIVKGDASD